MGGQSSTKCAVQESDIVNARESDARTPQELGLWSLWREDLKTHYGDWTLPGYRTLAVCRFGQWRMKVRPKLLRAPLSMIYRWLFRRCRNRYGIELPYSVVLGRRVRI